MQIRKRSKERGIENITQEIRMKFQNADAKHENLKNKLSSAQALNEEDTAAYTPAVQSGVTQLSNKSTAGGYMFLTRNLFDVSIHMQKCESNTKLYSANNL
jgi:hypothetical protein